MNSAERSDEQLNKWVAPTRFVSSLAHSLTHLQLPTRISDLRHVPRRVVIIRQFDVLLRVEIIKFLRYPEGQVRFSESDPDEKGFGIVGALLLFRQISHP